MRICTVPGCGSKHKGLGYCATHYDRLRKRGVVGGAERLKLFGANLEDRLRRWGWTVTESGCWEWGGLRDPDNYGKVSVTGGRVQMLAHRAAYEVWVGPIPDGAVVMHKCDNPPCINPDHLSTGTQLDNIQDMVTKGRGRGRHSPQRLYVPTEKAGE